VTDAPLLRHAVTNVHGRYLVRPASGPSRRWLVGFHGQAQTAEAFLADLDRIPRGAEWLVASVQGLNRWTTRSGQVVAGWMTREDRELAIADNVAWVDAALDAIEVEFGPPRAIVFAGFSQGVAMAYRAGLLGRRACAAIVAASGDVPPDLALDARPWPRVLAATGSRDAWYTPERLAADVGVLRGARADARAVVFDGGHEWAPALVEATSALLREIEGDGG
jgi:predicted esterase